MFRFVVLACFDLGLTVVMDIYVYNIFIAWRQHRRI